MPRNTYLPTCWAVKKFYNRFTHSITFKQDDPEILNFAATKLGKNCRSRTNKKNMTVYCTSAGYQILMDKFGDRAISVTRPIDHEAEELLNAGYQISTRGTLYYGKHRYSCQFYCSNKEAYADLESWLSSTYGPATKNGEWRFRNSRYFPILYCSDRSMIDMVKLAEPAKLVSLTKVYTYEDIRAALQ
jgi:hypothetical protein